MFLRDLILDILRQELARVLVVLLRCFFPRHSVDGPAPTTFSAPFANDLGGGKDFFLRLRGMVVILASSIRKKCNNLGGLECWSSSPQRVTRV